MSAVTTTATNFYEVHNAEQFKELMSADLKRVALINFWTPWAAPCKENNAAVVELASKYPSLLVLQVEAEEQSAITESFDIEAVPTIIILRGHALLDRISGYDAPRLVTSIAKHMTQGPYEPLSRSDVQPAKASDVPVVAESKETLKEEEGETEEQLNARLKKLMNQSKVVLFMKGNPDEPRCGFSRKIVALLKDQKVEFSHFDILTDENVRQGLKKLNDWPTFPQLIVGGELVGGLDIAKEMIDTGEFQQLIA